jgi:hypothetical protein
MYLIDVDPMINLLTTRDQGIHMLFREGAELSHR